MRASPAFQISLQRYGVWRGAVWLLAALGAAAIAAWLATRAQSISVGYAVAVGLAAMLMLWMTASLSRMPLMNLRWDGQVWHLAQQNSANAASAAGVLDVVIDLGPWMLLRFTPATPVRQPRITWLPLQRRGIEAQWHALRCAVYSPRPVPGGDAAAEL